MALVLTEEQSMIRDSAAGLLSEKATVAQLRELRDSNDELGFSKPVWQEMVDMGWAGITIPEEFGGSGFGYVGLGLILEQAGRNLSASPLQSTVLTGATLLAQLATREQQQTLFPAVAQGKTLLALALQEGPHHAPENSTLSAYLERDNYILSGRKRMVLDAHVANQFIVIARTAGSAGDESGLSAFLVDAESDGISVQRRSMVDSRNSGSLLLDKVKVPAANLLGDAGEAWDGLTRALDIVNIGLAAEMLGLSCEAFERTVSYLQERQQFGQLIGSFQGLQHRAAQMFVELELARSIVLQSLQAIDAESDSLSRLASAAKARLCEVAELISNEAIQMHGGIGMTDEHEIGFFIKRARMAQHCFGDYNYHVDRFALLSGF